MINQTDWVPDPYQTPKDQMVSGYGCFWAAGLVLVYNPCFPGWLPLARGNLSTTIYAAQDIGRLCASLQIWSHKLPPSSSHCQEALEAAWEVASSGLGSFQPSCKSEYDAFLPYEHSLVEEAWKAITWLAAKTCQVAAKWQVGGSRHGQFGHVPPMYWSTTASVGALALTASFFVSCCTNPAPAVCNPPPGPPPKHTKRGSRKTQNARKDSHYMAFTKLKSGQLYSTRIKLPWSLYLCWVIRVVGPNLEIPFCAQPCSATICCWCRSLVTVPLALRIDQAPYQTAAHAWTWT